MMWFFMNCTMAVVITPYLLYKITKLFKRKSIEEVLFANNTSGCCNDFTNPKTCGSRYCLKKNVLLITDLINQSKHSVCLALYSLNLEEVKVALIKASRRGVEVKVITTGGAMQSLSNNLIQLSFAGINVRFPKSLEECLLHHKFAVIDGKIPEKKLKQKGANTIEGVLLTGSMNWTIRSFTSNWDNIIVTSNEELVLKYQNEFDAIWQLMRPTGRIDIK